MGLPDSHPDARLRARRLAHSEVARPHGGARHAEVECVRDAANGVGLHDHIEPSVPLRRLQQARAAAQDARQLECRPSTLGVLEPERVLCAARLCAARLLAPAGPAEYRLTVTPDDVKYVCQKTPESAALFPDAA